MQQTDKLVENFKYFHSVPQLFYSVCFQLHFILVKSLITTGLTQSFNFQVIREFFTLKFSTITQKNSLVINEKSYWFNQMLKEHFSTKKKKNFSKTM